jgi:ribosomal protein S18 acetylase RimI-like enzyme
MWTVRSAGAPDLPAVVDLWDREGGPTSMPGGLREVGALLRRDPDALVVAMTSDSIVIGALIVGWDGWRCHLYRLAVEPGYRRRGIARALVAEAARRAVALGARRLDAMVSLENTTAVAFWEGNGFRRHEGEGRFSLVAS